MNNNRALLEAAARAAGLSGFTYINGRGAVHDPKPGIMQPYRAWNPLDNDGDRYRLAKVCELRIDFMSQYARTADGSQKFFWTTTGQGDDEAHAIVRAAAAMVKT